MKKQLPIGIFDSGLGGLTIHEQIRSLLPTENLIYVADNAHLPYGNKSESYVRSRSHAIAEFLGMQDVKAIVVACNTATSAAIDTIRQAVQIPVVGIEPAVKPAAQATRRGKVGVLATRGTLSSERFAELMKKFGSNAEVLIQPCEGWVEQIETGRVEGPEAETLVASYVIPLIRSGVDCLVLGCTHYPFFEKLIQRVAGDEVTIIDPSEAVVRQLARRLEESGLLNDSGTAGAEHFYSSGSAIDQIKIMSGLLGRTIAVQRLPNVFSTFSGAPGQSDEGSLAVGL